MKKIVRIDMRANKEIQKFPRDVIAIIHAYLKELEKFGRLIPPCGKKIGRNMYEIRVHHHGQWRTFYAYMTEEYVMVLLAFQKKTQKTPQAIIKLAELCGREYGL